MINIKKYFVKNFLYKYFSILLLIKTIQMIIFKILILQICYYFKKFQVIE